MYQYVNISTYHMQGSKFDTGDEINRNRLHINPNKKKINKVE